MFGTLADLQIKAAKLRETPEYLELRRKRSEVDGERLEIYNKMEQIFKDRGLFDYETNKLKNCEETFKIEESAEYRELGEKASRLTSISEGFDREIHSIEARPYLEALEQKKMLGNVIWAVTIVVAGILVS